MTAVITRRVREDGRALLALIVLLGAVALAAVVPGFAEADPTDGWDVTVTLDGEEEPDGLTAGDTSTVTVTIEDGDGPVVGQEVGLELDAPDMRRQQELDWQDSRAPEDTDEQGQASFDVEFTRAGTFGVVLLADVDGSGWIVGEEVARIDVSVQPADTVGLGATIIFDAELDPEADGYAFARPVIWLDDPGPTWVEVVTVDAFGNATGEELADIEVAEDPNGVVEVVLEERVSDERFALTLAFERPDDGERLAWPITFAETGEDASSPLEGVMHVTDDQRILRDEGALVANPVDTEGEPLEEVCVAAGAVEDVVPTSAQHSDAGGLQSLASGAPEDGSIFPAGTYIVVFTACETGDPGITRTYWDGTSNGTTEVEDAKPVEVERFRVTDLGDIEIAEEPTGTLEVTVDGLGDGAGEVCVEALPEPGSNGRFADAILDLDGTPSLRLQAGEYVVAVADCEQESPRFARTYFPSEPGRTTAEAITIEADELTEVEVDVLPAARISGEVRVAEGIDDVQRLCVATFAEDQNSARSHCQDGDGDFAYDLDVAAVDLRLQAWAQLPDRQIHRRYLEDDPTGTDDPDAATLLSPEEGETLTGIDVEITEADPDAPEPAAIEVVDAPASLLSGETGSIEVEVTTPDGDPATGLVEVRADGEVLSSAPLADDADDAGTATLEVELTETGTAELEVRYLGDGTDEVGPASTTVDVDILPAPTTLSTDPAGPLLLDPDETATVNIEVEVDEPATGTPTGDVRIEGLSPEPLDRPLEPSGTGTAASASLELSDLDPGEYPLTFTYLGDDDREPSAPVNLDVTVRNPVDIAVEVDPQEPVVGQATDVAVTATLAATDAPAEGELTLQLDGTPLDVASDDDGVFTAGFTPDSAGSTELAWTFDADDEQAVSTTSGDREVTVAPAETVTTVEVPERIDPEDEPTATIQVTPSAPGGGTPEGEVTLTRDDGAVEVAADDLDDGTLTVPLDELPIGSHELVAGFAGSDDHLASTSDPADVTVRAPVDLTARPDPDEPVYGEPVDLEIELESDGDIDPPAMATVQVTVDDGPAAEVELTDGVGVLTLADGEPLEVGTRTAEVTFAGDELRTPGETVREVEISPAPTETTVDGPDEPISELREAVLEIEVAATRGAATPAGAIVVTDGDDELARTSAPTGTISLDELPVGTSDLDVRFEPDDDPRRFTASEATPVTIEVLDAETATTATAEPTDPLVGQSVDVDVEVAAVADALDPALGPVELQLWGPSQDPDDPEDGTRLSATDLVDGEATVTIPAAELRAVGTFEVAVRYLGDDDRAPSGTTVSVEVAATPTSIDAPDAVSVVEDERLEVDVAVTPDPSSGEVPTGTVELRDTDEAVLVEAELDDGSTNLEAEAAELDSGAFELVYVPDSALHLPADRALEVEVLELPALELDVEVERDPGDPLQREVSFEVSGGGDPIEWRLDAGDGRDAVEGDGRTATRTLTYEPGTYRLRVVASDPRGEDHAVGSSRTVEIVAPDEPLEPRAGDDRVTTVDETVALDASASSPGADAAERRWDLGDGREVEGERVEVAWPEAGTYTVTLTLDDGQNQATDEVEVRVEEPRPEGLEVEVVDDAGQQPLAGAEVLLVEPDGALRSTTTDDDGSAWLTDLDDGPVRLAVYADGYQPTWADAEVADGEGSVTVALEAGDLVDADLTAERIDPERAAELGVDLDDDDNQLIWEVETKLRVRGGFWSPGTGESQEVLVHDGEGRFIWHNTPEGTSCREDGTCRTNVGGVTVYRSVGGGGFAGGRAPTITYLVVPVEGRILKEFFEVHLEVVNLSEDFDLVDMAASLELPEGLGLASLVQGRQQPEVELGTIAGGDAAGQTWVVRGDEPGSYTLDATARGELELFGAPVEIDAATEDPIRIWGTDALRFHVEADETVAARTPYTMRLGLENVADIDVHGAQLTFLEGTENVIYQPRQQRSYPLGTIEPGETAWTDAATLVPSVSGWIDPSGSYVATLAGAAPPAEIDLVPVAQPADELLELTVSSRSRYHLLQIEEDAAATETRPFVTDDLDTQFPDEPMLTADPPGLPDDLVAVSRDDVDRGELGISSTIDGRPTLRHSVQPIGVGTPREPRTRISFSDGAATMCGEPATLSGELHDPLLELDAYEIRVGDGEVERHEVSGQEADTAPYTFEPGSQPGEVGPDGLRVSIRAIDAIGNKGAWSSVILRPDCPGRPVAVLAAGLFSSLEDDDDYFAELFGTPDDGPDESVVGLLTDLGYDLGHDGEGPRDSANRDIIEYSYQGADVGSNGDGPVFEPNDYRRRDTVARVSGLAAGSLRDLVGIGGQLLEIREPQRSQARSFLDDLVDYDQTWHDHHDEWLRFNLIGHSLGARQSLEVAVEAQIRADACEDGTGHQRPDYPCQRYQELIGAVVSVSGAVYPSAIGRDIGVASCALSTDIFLGDLAFDVAAGPVLNVRGVSSVGLAVQRSIIGEELRVANRFGDSIDTMGTPQDQCLPLSATLAEEGLGIGRWEETVNAEGLTAHAALFDGTTTTPGDFRPLRDRLLDQFPTAGRATVPSLAAHDDALSIYLQDRVLTSHELFTSTSDTTSTAAESGAPLVVELQDGDGEPVADGAVVVYRGTSQVAVEETSSDGRAEIDGLSAGSYTVQAGGIGWTTEQRSDVEVPEDEPLAVELEPAAYSVLELTGAQDDRPLAGVVVEVRDDADTVVGAGVTDALGTVVITDLPEGELEASFTDPEDLHDLEVTTATVTAGEEPPAERRESLSLSTGYVPDEELFASPDPGEADDPVDEEPGDDDAPDGPGAAPPGDGHEEQSPAGQDPDIPSLDWPVCGDVDPVMFEDLPTGATHAAAAGCLAALDVLRGVGEDRMAPQETIRRDQFASLLDRLLRDAGWEGPSGPAGFDDVEGTHASSIDRLANAGIIDGREPGRFDPGGELTRGQLVALLARAADLVGTPFPDGGDDFADTGRTTHADDIARSRAAGLAEGFDDGSFRPGRAVQRDQTASLLVRWLEWQEESAY